MSEEVLKIVHVSKYYGSKLVLNNVNMTINRGDIYGFVGENGAGKTTVIRAITGLIKCDNGYMEYFGYKNDSSEYYEKLKKFSGIVEAPSIFGNLSSLDNIYYQQSLFGFKDEANAKHLLELVNLADTIDTKKQAGDFSLGMRQRLAIAMCLVNDPELLIFDEPMNGLDPQGIVELRNLILELNKAGVTFLISSHILTELSLVATKYGIISHGKIKLEATKEEIDAKLQKTTFIDTLDNLKAYELLLQNMPSMKMSLADKIELYGDIDNNSVFKIFIDNNITVKSLSTKEASFEDFYLELMGGNK